MEAIETIIRVLIILVGITILLTVVRIKIIDLIKFPSRRRRGSE